MPLAVAVALSVVALSSVARADPKECAAAYEQTQSLKHAGKLSSAREKALICARDTCADFIRADCAKWLGEIESSQPTVVFDVRDAAGGETSAARVSLDGKPWLDKLDGSAKAIDSGQHALRVEIDGAPGVDQTVQIREGEKNRVLRVTFQKTTAQVGDAPQPLAPRGDAPARSIAPWLIGGVGIAGLAVGGILGALVLADKSTTDAECNPTTLRCTPAGVSAANSGRTLGPISTVGFVVGGLGVGVSAVWLIARAPAKSDAPVATLGMGPLATANGGGWRFSGSW